MNTIKGYVICEKEDIPNSLNSHVLSPMHPCKQLPFTLLHVRLMQFSLHSCWHL